jgi:hypothetical protein
MRLRRFLLLSAAGLAALLGGAALLSGTSHATDAAPCPPGVAGTFVNFSRAIVPIGATAVRDFGMKDHPASKVQLSAPPEYNAVQVPASVGSGLRFKAPQAGAFAVQGTWTEFYYDGTATVPCTATADSTLTAGRGTPLTVKPPRATRENGSTVVENPTVWTWKCTASSDPAPLTVRVRWEIDKRSIPRGSRGGHAPFKFSRRAQAFSATSADPCDFRQTGEKTVKLPKSAKLGAALGRYEYGGNLTVSFLGPQPGGAFRNPKGDAAPLHVGVVLTQGSRSLVSSRLCAWYNTGFVVAKGSGVSCWW